MSVQPPLPEDEVLRLAEGVWKRYGGPPTLPVVNMAETEEPAPPPVAHRARTT